MKSSSAEVEDEEEMITLGLSRSGSSGENNGTAATSSTPGTNPKSFPATPGGVGRSQHVGQPQQAQQHRSGGGQHKPIRRTPGPPMSGMQNVGRQARHRRTPGAHSHDEQDFGRSHARTPVMSGAGGSSNRMGRRTPQHKQQHLPLSSSSPLVTPGNNKATNNTYNHHNRQLYTPAHFTLAKNADLHMMNRPDAFSPATIRMTDSLEKILTDDDDYVDARQRAALLAQQQQHQMQQQAQIGAFRRIQSRAEDDDSDDDQEMDEMKDLDETVRGEVLSSEDEEEEAEISLINEDGNDDDIGHQDAAEDTSKLVDGGSNSISRPKPLNLSGGAFMPPTKKPSSLKRAVAAAKTGSSVKSVHTPKPQRTVPRHPAAAGGGPTAYQGGPHPPNQGYYPPPSHFGPPIAPGWSSHDHQAPPPQHLQYSQHPHLQSPHQYHPPQPHPHHFPPPQQNFHMPSPQNTGYALPTGLVSPLTIPETAQYHTSPQFTHSPHGNNWHHPPSPHHQMQTIPPDFGPNQVVGGGGPPVPGMGGDQWSWNRGGGGAAAPPPSGQRAMHLPGHASPDLFFHEQQRGAVSPFTLPGMQPPYGNNCPPQQQQQYGSAGHMSFPKPRERHIDGKKGSTTTTGEDLKSSVSPPPATKQPQQRTRLDSADVASINSTKSAFSGRHLPTAPTASSSSEEADQHQHGSSVDWFHPSTMSLNHTLDSGGSVGTSSASGGVIRLGSGGTVSKKQHMMASGRGAKNEPIMSSGAAAAAEGMIMALKQQHGSSRGGGGLSAAEGNKLLQQGIGGVGISNRKARSDVFRAVDETVTTERQRQQRGTSHAEQQQYINESPTDRQAYKEFARAFRQKENNESLDSARDYALACLDVKNHTLYLPSVVHWRVYLELADVSKRSNKIDDARSYYRKACTLQPNGSQGWLEHSKLEEEGGNLARCAEILQEGLDHCLTSENLLIRAIKFYERIGKLDDARRLLSRLKYLSIDKSWKTMLEGALLEARAGRYSMAREVLKYLTHYVPWYGPLYLAHTKLERDYGSPSEALVIVEKGLKELPRYGPLYFQAFRLLEKEDLAAKAYDLPRTMKMIERADWISRELLWKVHLEAAQMRERAAALSVENDPKLDLRTALQATRKSYAKAVMLCPPNLTWKVWLAAGRTEVSCLNTRGARDLFLRAYGCVSEKGRSTVLLECARLEEFVGDVSLSRSILCKARNLFGKSDWKVWLSSVNLECRCGKRKRAIAFAQEALNMHRGTGRLWAALIQLRHDDGELYQMKVLKCALQAVPKSGEVWCEGARIHLNPFSPTFDLRTASRHLSFAARFTPQYGDSFLEQLRVNMIDQWLIPLASPFIKEIYDAFSSRDDQMEIEDAYQFISEHTKKAADVVKTQLEEEWEKEGTTKLGIKRDVLDTSKLELRCSSADPNYGHLWFQCRGSPIDTAREVIVQAKTVMADSIIDYSYLYIAAMVRRAGVLMFIQSTQGLPPPNSRKWDRIVDKQLRLAPPLDEMLPSGRDLGSIFTTGCAGNNRDWGKLSLTEKREILFGSDSLLS